MTKHFLLLPLLLLLTACGAVEVAVEEGTPTVPVAGILPTLPPATLTPTVTAAPPTETAVPPTPTPILPTASPTAAQAPAAPDEEASYQVAFVAPDDQLNVRAEPDPEAEIVGTLSPQTADIEISGPGEEAAGHTWVPIQAGALAGWVNSLYLTETVAPDTFCDDEAARALVDAFRAAVAAEDEATLAELINPQRGLHVRVSWWNPEVWLLGPAVEDLLRSDALYDWGVEDGSGDAIRGSFRDVILPMLERDLLPAGEVACDEILHGGTAGIVQLPETYQGVNFYAFHRPPGPDDFEMDWGTWVVGVEKWQGAYQIAYLVHFAWEI